MRSLPLKAATFLIVAGAWACGGDGSGVGPEDPAANFTAPTNCTAGQPCSFTDQSTGTVTGWSWNFGDNTAADINQNPTHTYAAAGTYNVTLTVTGNGKTSQKSASVVVGGGTGGNLAPTADFTFDACTVGAACAFHDASTDDVGVTNWSWNFGDGTPLDNVNQNPTHTFGAEGSYQVTLIVKDAGGLADTLTQAVPVSAAASQDCTASGITTTCTLTLAQNSTVTLTLNSTDCQITNDKISIGLPRTQNAFFNVCTKAPGSTYTVKDANGAALVMAAGTQIQIVFTQGQIDPGDPTPGTPGGRVDGTSPNWTISFEDGGNPSGAGEPDFNDAVIGVVATPAP
jgi:PKD repeat protein